MKGLAHLREKKGLTRAQLAKILDITRNRLTMWETLKAWPPAWILPKMANALGVTIEELYVTPGSIEMP